MGFYLVVCTRKEGSWCHVTGAWSSDAQEDFFSHSAVGMFGTKELFYLTTHSTHFIYGYMAEFGPKGPKIKGNAGQDKYLKKKKKKVFKYFFFVKPTSRSWLTLASWGWERGRGTAWRVCECSDKSLERSSNISQSSESPGSPASSSAKSAELAAASGK